MLLFMIGKGRSPTCIPGVFNKSSCGCVANSSNNLSPRQHRRHFTPTLTTSAKHATLTFTFVTHFRQTCYTHFHSLLSLTFTKHATLTFTHFRQTCYTHSHSLLSLSPNMLHSLLSITFTKHATLTFTHFCQSLSPNMLHSLSLTLVTHF